MVREQQALHDPRIRLVVATDRPIVETFFELLVAGDAPFLGADFISVSANELDQDADALAAATAGVVDLGPDPPAGIALCRELRRRCPELPLAAIVCCPDAATAWNLRALVDGGVGSILDLQGTLHETRRALETLADGGSVLQLRLRRGRAVLGEMLGGGPPKGETQLRLLALLARGLPDREIAPRLHLSPHTVKHQIEALRRVIGVRNRIELAAWAGRHGFYSLETEEPRAGLRRPHPEAVSGG